MTDNANMVSTETHEALLAKAVTDATASTDAALADKAAQVTELEGQLAAAQAELATVKQDNERLNSELDQAQVDLKAAQDKAAQFESDLSQERQAREKADTASKRAEQVRNLELFTDEFIAEKAESWAGLDEAAWTERVEEWKTLKPAEAGTGASTDSASAMTGTSDSLTKSTAEAGTDAASATNQSARRAVLGLV